MLSRFWPLLRCDLAIDLGTAATRIALPGEGVVLAEPTVVAVADGGNRILSGGCAVGHLARQMSGRTPNSVRVVRPLAGGVITDFELCEALLRYFMHKALPTRYGRRPRVLLAVPGCLTPVEKRAVYTSAHRAGAGQVLLVSVAQAAALGVGLPVAEPLASMVVDIGAGKTDVAVLSLGDIVARRCVRTGGDAMDAALAAHLHAAHNLRVGLATAEQLRIDLGTAWDVNSVGTQEVRGVDAANGLPRRVNITSAEVREALAAPLAEILEAVRGTLDGCTPDLVADVVDRGAVLCGGVAQLPGLTEWLAARAGIPARVAAEPLTAVATGTLACLEHLEAWSSLVEASDGAL